MVTGAHFRGTLPAMIATDIGAAFARLREEP
jgi:hypothetical protein